MIKWVKYGIVSIVSLLIITGVVIGIVLTVIFNIHAESQENKKNNTEKTETIKKKSNDSKQTVIENGTISFEKYMSLEKGMSYKKAAQILGVEGQLQSESHGVSIGKSYEFSVDELGTTTVNIGFTDDELVQKSYFSFQFQKTDIELTADQFDQIKSGDSYEALIEIAGGEGILRGTHGFPNTEGYGFTIAYSGQDKYSDATFSFVNNELMSKTQSGLR